MNEPKQTPGPWHVNAILNDRIVGDETAERFDKLMINSHNATIATVYRSIDARLIAEAPKLLAALEEISRVVRKFDGLVGDTLRESVELNPGTVSSLFRACRHARDVLASATGGKGIAP